MKKSDSALREVERGGGSPLQPWAGLSTATVSDALDRHGIAGQVIGVAPLSTSFRMVGRAYTVRMVPTSGLGGTVGDYIDDVPTGAVVVLDNEGRLDMTVWGDLLTLTAHTRGVAGTVIHGVCRDVNSSLRLGYPIFSRGVSMRTGKGRVRAEAFQVPVSLGATTVEPDALMLGDADGVIVVPQEMEEKVLHTARLIHEAEEHICAAVVNGASLAVAREQFGYHRLQQRRRS